MRFLLILATAAVLCLGARVQAEHLVPQDALDNRMAAAEQARQRSLATINRVLSSPRTTSAAAALDVDVSELKAHLAGLSDAELYELAARSRALGLDPAAGLSGSTDDVLVVVLIVLIALLVLKAI